LGTAVKLAKIKKENVADEETEGDKTWKPE
jgi:hypothetical protein